MNKLSVRLSFAFFGVIVLTIVTIFSFLFAFSLLAGIELTEEEYDLDYSDLTEDYVLAYIIEGKSDEEIVEILNREERVQALIAQVRAEGFEAGMQEDRLFSWVAKEYFLALLDRDVMVIILIGTIIGIITSIFVSRKLTQPLAELTEASHLLRHHNLAERVEVQGTSEINELASAFNRMASQLERAEEVRQNMLADVSHELRTPLAGLEGTLRATLDGVFELDDQHISNLYTQTRHLTHLVDDLHLLARAESQRLSLNKTQIDLATLTQNLAETFDVLALNEDIELVRAVEPVPNIYGDAIRIRQILSNLLNNALRHTPSGGSIILAVTQSNNRVQVNIRDTGEGIEADFLPHLFDRFYRVDQSRSREKGGTGLGLAITKALVEAHGGSITAASDGVGLGSTFTIMFPL